MKEQHRPLKLNFGCGDEIINEYVNVDKVRLPGVDLIWNLEKTPLPFKTNSVSEIKVEHILEHINNFMPLMEEIHRISKPGAKIHVLAPYYKYEGSYRDPTHVRFFTEHSFDYFQDGVKFSHYSKARFKVLKVEPRTRFLSSVRNSQKRIIPYIPFKSFFNIFFWNVFTELKYELEVVK